MVRLVKESILWYFKVVVLEGSLGLIPLTGLRQLPNYDHHLLLSIYRSIRGTLERTERSVRCGNGVNVHGLSPGSTEKMSGALSRSGVFGAVYATTATRIGHCR